MNLFFKIIFCLGISLFIYYMSLPKLSHGVSSNETSAIGILRTLFHAQKQFKELGLKDRDQDGIGEYGYFVELAGVMPVPVGTELKKAVKPIFINSVFGKTSQENEGIAKGSGYYFKIYLPSNEKYPKGENGKVVNPVKKLPPNAEIAEEINLQEMRWCAYGWPEDAGRGLGSKAFFINELGEVIATSNLPVGASTLYYSGTTKMPDVFDIYENKDKGDLSGKLITGKPTINQIFWNPTS